jgi:hypothetical protein
VFTFCPVSGHFAKKLLAGVKSDNSFLPTALALQKPSAAPDVIPDVNIKEKSVDFGANFLGRRALWLNLHRILLPMQGRLKTPAPQRLKRMNCRAARF